LFQKELFQQDLFRIGDKIVSPGKIQDMVKKIFMLRSQGLSQQEVANSLHLDRSFISRLESIGELRKGKKIALIGFPLENKGEIRKIADESGIDFIWLMDEKERWEMVKEKSALDFFDEVMETITALQQYDTIIMISSLKWKKLAEALLTGQILFIELGISPITENCFLSPQEFKQVLAKVDLLQGVQVEKEGG